MLRTRRAVVVTVVALTASALGAGPALASAALIVRSHSVQRTLPREADRTLPVHEGGSVVIQASKRIEGLAVRWAGDLIRAERRGRSDRRWRFFVPVGTAPPRATLIGKLAGQRFRQRLRPRHHEHSRIETAPGRLVDGREVFWIEWAFRPQSLRELFSPPPKSFENRPAVEAAAVAIVRRKTKAKIADDHPDYEIPAQHVHFRTKHRWFGKGLKRRFRILKTGNDDVWAAGDPRYLIGERYVLFLDRRSDGVFIPVAPEGRYLVQDGTLRPVMAGRVGRVFSGLTVEEARSVALRAR